MGLFRSLRPDRMYPDVTCITARELEGMGVRALMLDIDGTLMPTKAGGLNDDVLRWLDDMKEAGIGLFILSNSRRVWRVRELGEQLGLPWIARARKPRRKGFGEGIAALGLAPGQVGMVGDQTFTDVWGGNRAGCVTLLVETTDNRLIQHYLRRPFETPFRREKRRL